jgi:hypothetical protein
MFAARCVTTHRETVPDGMTVGPDHHAPIRLPATTLLEVIVRF